jgi:hypothetical protein
MCVDVKQGRWDGWMGIKGKLEVRIVGKNQKRKETRRTRFGTA